MYLRTVRLCSGVGSKWWLSFEKKLSNHYDQHQQETAEVLPHYSIRSDCQKQISDPHGSMLYISYYSLLLRYVELYKIPVNGFSQLVIDAADTAIDAAESATDAAACYRPLGDPRGSTSTLNGVGLGFQLQ